jgi:DNA-binding NarL/FixJ family response regulator
MRMMKTTTIMVVAGPGVVRDGYQALFGAVAGFHALEPADDGPSALARLSIEKPDAIILDTSVDPDDAKSILGSIKRSSHPARCLIVCSDVSRTRAMCGADAAVVEGVPPADLVSTVKQMVLDIGRQTE